MYGKILSIYGFHLPWKCIEIESIDCTLAPVSQSKLQVEFFENLFPQDEGKSGGNYDLLYQKFNQKKSRWPETLIYLYFLWFVFFLNVMALVLWVMSIK